MGFFINFPCYFIYCSRILQKKSFLNWIMLQMRINSIKAWERRDSPAWPPLRKLQELIRHFRLGDLITRLHERAGQCHWTMQLSEGPVNLIGEASGRECSAVKDKVAVDLIDKIQVCVGSTTTWSGTWSWKPTWLHSVSNRLRFPF